MRLEDIKVPGIYAIIEEGSLSANPITEVGKTPTIICDAPDYFFVADAVYGGVNGVRAVAVNDNTVYVIENPDELLKTIRGEIFAEGALTQDQLDSMRCPQLENALEIAKEAKKRFAFVKMIKRDGSRPDMSNTLEVYQAHEYTAEALSVVNVGKIVPFGFSIDQVFALDEAEAASSLTIESKVGSFNKYDETVFANKYTLDIERDTTATVLFRVEDHGATTTDSIANDVKANIFVRDAQGVEKKVLGDLAVEYKGNFDYNGTTAKAIVLAENTVVNVLPGEVELSMNKGTLVAIVAAEGSGDLIKTVGGELILNYDVVNIATPTGATPIGAPQGFGFTVKVVRNPYAKVTSLTEPAYDSKIQVVQGVNNETLLKNFNPEKADSYVLTFGLNPAKDAADVYKHLDEERKEKIGTVEVVASVADPKVFVTTKETVLKLEETGLSVILPATLKVHNENATYDTSLGNSIFYNIEFEVKGQPSYKIDVVPAEASFANLYAKFAHKLVFELDETQVYLSASLLESDSNTAKKSYVEKLEKLAIRGSLKEQLSASNVQDIGKYLAVVVGAAKTLGGVGGFKALFQLRVDDFGRTNGGAGAIEPLTKTIIVRDGSQLRKGDTIEISTIKRKKSYVMKATIQKITRMIDGRYNVTVDKDVDTAVFDKALFDITLAVTNKKDLLGNYAAFKYAIFADTVENGAPVRQYMSGTAELTFNKKLIEKLDAAGYTVLNNDPNQAGIFIENIPTMANTNNQFAKQSAVGAIFWVQRKLRTIGRAYQGKNMNNPENQSSYADRVKKVEAEAKAAYVVTAISITPDFRYVSKGKLFAKQIIKEAETLSEIVYYSAIDKE